MIWNIQGICEAKNYGIRAKTMVSLQDVSKIGEISAGVRAFWLKWRKIGRYKLQNSCVESLNICGWINFPDWLLPEKEFLGRQEKAAHFSCQYLLPCWKEWSVPLPVESQRLRFTQQQLALAGQKPSPVENTVCKRLVPVQTSSVQDILHIIYQRKRACPKHWICICNFGVFVFASAEILEESQKIALILFKQALRWNCTF